MTCPHCAAPESVIYCWLVYAVEMATCYRCGWVWFTGRRIEYG